MGGLAVFKFWAEPGATNAADWPSGTVQVSVPAYVVPSGGATYKMWPRLFRGQHQGDAEANPWDTGTDSTPPEGLKQVLGATPARHTFAVPVRALSGAPSDRLLVEVMAERDDGNTGGEVYVYSDGSTMQLAVVTPFASEASVSPSLRRNADTMRPGNTLSTAIETTASLGTFATQAGDPGVSVWHGRVWRWRIWAKVAAGGSVALTGSVARGPAAGGAPTVLGTVNLGTVTSTTWALYQGVVLVPDSSGLDTDLIVVSLSASAASPTTITVGIGYDHPSSVNSALNAPPGGTSDAPTDDHKVAVQTGGIPGYLSEVVQSEDASVLVTVSPSTDKLDLKVTGYINERLHEHADTSHWNDATGLLVVGATNCASVTVTGDVTGIFLAGWRGGERLDLWLHGSGHYVQGGASVSGVGGAAFFLRSGPDGNPMTHLKIGANGLYLQLRYIDGVWKQIATEVL